MKVLIAYDSVYGNTESIAKAIRAGMDGDVNIQRASAVTTDQLEGIDLLVIGTPTHGGRPTPDVQSLLNKIPATSFKGVKIAAFDTRNSGRFVRIFGFAAERVSDQLISKGGTAAAPPEGFFVKGRTGPLKDGELERATAWARRLAK